MSPRVYIHFRFSLCPTRAVSNCTTQHASTLRRHGHDRECHVRHVSFQSQNRTTPRRVLHGFGARSAERRAMHQLRPSSLRCPTQGTRTASEYGHVVAAEPESTNMSCSRPSSELQRAQAREQCSSDPTCKLNTKRSLSLMWSMMERGGRHWYCARSMLLVNLSMLPRLPSFSCQRRDVHLCIPLQAIFTCPT